MTVPSSISSAQAPEIRAGPRKEGLLLAPAGHEDDALRAVRGRFGIDSWRTMTRGEFQGLGVAGVVRALRRLRTPCFVVYTPDLKTDPDLSLLRFTALIP